ncbi:MAG: undecaprenyl-diphosphate phosphatase [Acholeplasmataceae bacterium]
MLDWIKYIILGIVQGITEILPISSSGHLTLLTHVFNMDTANLTIFLMLTNTGSFLAILYFFRADIISLIHGSYRFVFQKKDIYKDDWFDALKVFVAVLPVGIVGLLFEDLLPDDLFTVGIALVVTGSLLFFIYSNRHFEYNKPIGFKNALIVGLFQMFAVVPGISRSGITLTGGLIQKISLKKALKFSFLSYVAISFPVSILGFIRASAATESIHLGGYLIASVLSFIFSYLAVKWLYEYVKIKNLIYFSVYCLVVGLLAVMIYFI